MQDTLDQDVIDFAGRKANAQPATTAADDGPLSDDEIAARAGAAHELLQLLQSARQSREEVSDICDHGRRRRSPMSRPPRSSALRTWAAMVAQTVLSGMSTLMDELIQSHLLDDDDEETDES